MGIHNQSLGLPDDTSFVYALKNPPDRRFFPIVSFQVQETGVLVPLISSGWELMTRQDALDLAGELELFVESFTDDEIAKENHEFEIQREMEMRGIGREEACAILLRKEEGKPTALKNGKAVSGYIYLLHAVGTNRYKIGLTRNISRRISQLQKQSPYPIKCVHYFQALDVIGTEFDLHTTYSKYRVHGEWFELPQFAVEQICSIKDEGIKP